VTDKSDGARGVPGATAGDAAPTQAIPRIPKPVSDQPASGKPAATKPPTTNDSKDPAVTETDKGRPRRAPATSTPAPPAPAAKAPSVPPPSAPAAKKAESEPKRSAEPSGGPTGRPLTAAEYARTTKGSPATTSIIPAVREKMRSRRESSPVATLAPNPGAGSGRRASLRLTHVEPWSVTRLAFSISVAMMIVSVVAVVIFWTVLNVAGVWDQINDSFTTVLSDDSTSFNVKDYFGFTRVVGLTLVLSAVNVLAMTALATIAAHLYNLAAQLMGGVELTFAEEK
jgi:hypothetical protein